MAAPSPRESLSMSLQSVLRTLHGDESDGGIYFETWLHEGGVTVSAVDRRSMAKTKMKIADADIKRRLDGAKGDAIRWVDEVRSALLAQLDDAIRLELGIRGET